MEENNRDITNNSPNNNNNTNHRKFIKSKGIDIEAIRKSRDDSLTKIRKEKRIDRIAIERRKVSLFLNLSLEYLSCFIYCI